MELSSNSDSFLLHSPHALFTRLTWPYMYIHSRFVLTWHAVMALVGAGVQWEVVIGIQVPVECG